MAERAFVDATDNLELRRLAETVRDRKEPIVVRSEGQDIAMVVPIDEADRLKSFVPTKEQIETALAAAGSWKDLVDVDELKAQWRAARGSKRPPVDL